MDTSDPAGLLSPIGKPPCIYLRGESPLQQLQYSIQAFYTQTWRSLKQYTYSLRLMFQQAVQFPFQTSSVGTNLPYPASVCVRKRRRREGERERVIFWKKKKTGEQGAQMTYKINNVDVSAFFRSSFLMILFPNIPWTISSLKTLWNCRSRSCKERNTHMHTAHHIILYLSLHP